MLTDAPESSPIRFTNCNGIPKRSWLRKNSLCFSRNRSDEDDCSTSRPYYVIVYEPSGCLLISRASLRRCSCRKASVDARSSVRATSCMRRLLDCNVSSMPSRLSLASSNSNLSSPSESPNRITTPKHFTALCRITHRLLIKVITLCHLRREK